MKKSVRITAVILMILALIAVGGVVAFQKGKQPTEPAPVPPEITEPQPSETPEPTPAPEPQPEPEPEMPTEPEESVIVYVPDEQGDALTPIGAAAEDDSDQALVDALIAAGSLPSGAKVLSAKLEGDLLTLDMNEVYGEAVRSSGSTGETLLIYSLVNTFAQAKGASEVLILVEGGLLQSGHEVYDFALEPQL